MGQNDRSMAPPVLYDHVIVPYDGTLPAREGLAPAAGLAWRCGARIVIVNTTEASDRRSRQQVKAAAMAMSGADVDFWVDPDRSLGQALVETARHRSRPILCVPIRRKDTVLRRRPLLTAMPAEALLGAPCPVLVIGPETEIDQGLPLRELVVGLDGSAASESVLELALTWARALRLGVVLVGVVHDTRDRAHEAERAYLERHLARLAGEEPDLELSVELVGAQDPTEGLLHALAPREASILVMSTHGRGGVDRYPLGSVAQATMLRSPRALLFQRPRG
jgi:nucleotide-binding universal stress UspA family protein